LCLIVGLIAGDILYAASTPLGSNVMNPIMLFAATLATGTLAVVVKTHTRFGLICISATAIMAVGFFFIPASTHIFWIITALIVTAVLFLKRPAEEANGDEENSFSPIWFVPAFFILLAAGYVLDPIVSYTAQHSQAPKGIIGFLVLATLTRYCWLRQKA